MSLLPTKRALEIWVLGAWYDGAARTLPQRCFTAMLTPLGWLVARVAQRRRRARAPGTAVLPPVIVVGNLTVGGTGKTPVVAWLAVQLRADFLRGV